MGERKRGGDEWRWILRRRRQWMMKVEAFVLSRGREEKRNVRVEKVGEEGEKGEARECVCVCVCV